MNGEIFYSLKGEEEEKAVLWTDCPTNQVLIERWRRHYNGIRPHGALGYTPPAPETILPHAADLPSATQRLRADRRLHQDRSGLN